ncbi:MAG: PEP/pyruvate-binding domain-containing protein [Chloroflexota bacterium]|nr:PEP/pyruvate-binding domain-containing protein [Chloroflexota bacterium]
MEQPLSSKALEANLAQTRTQDIVIPAEHQRFLDYSKSHWGIHQRARGFILEYHHPYSNRQFVVEHWREIALRDVWFYNSLEEAEDAFAILLDISHDLLESDLDEILRETIVQTLLEFIGILSRQDTVRVSPISRCLDILHLYLVRDDLVVIRSSRYFKIYLAATSKLPEFSSAIFEISRESLEKTVRFWESTSNIEDWFTEKQTLFESGYARKIESIGKPFFADLHQKIEQAKEWDQLADIPSFDDMANHFHTFIEEFDSATEKIYFITYLLHLPGMHNLNDNLLWDINRLLKNVHSELDASEIISFSDNLFSLFEELKSGHMSTVLDCLLTLGLEIIDLGEQSIIDFFEDELIRFGFVAPGEVHVNQDWQVQVNVDHIKNIRVWLELIGYAPSRMKNLLSAFVVNLWLAGIFISDTDLFQRDVTKLLNSDVAPTFKQIKDLARLFPVYFSEIGAEGELRDISTAMDEISHRHDRLLHFLRKQIHTESNSTHLDLTRRIIRFLYDGNLDPLKSLVPADVLESIDLKGEWFIPVHAIVRQLCKQADCTPEHLLDVQREKAREMLANMHGYLESDKQRVGNLIKLYALLSDKYSFETVDIVPSLMKCRSLNMKDVQQLNSLLSINDDEAALRQVYLLMGQLAEVILDPQHSSGAETIYHKRHIAAGIPSMYGEYREPKFEALGLTFRLEKVASRLLEQMIQRINLDYITTSTLRRICNVLIIFQQGLELDGISHQGLTTNLRMLQSSFISASCSIDQYVNIFEFLEQNVKEIIDEYFLAPYDQHLRVIVPGLIDKGQGFSEAQIKQILHKRSEEFYRVILSSAFLIQTLDNFIANTMNALRNMTDHFSRDLIRDVMTYDPDLIVSPFYEDTPEMDNQIFMGAKAFFLKRLIATGFPVPQGFVLTTELFRHKESVLRHPQINREIDKFIRDHMVKLERLTGKQFGNSRNPLLLSVRSGTAISMPGAMCTFLNIGMNDEIVEGMSRQSLYGQAAWDCYRRFLQSWGMAHGIGRDDFDAINRDFESRFGVTRNIDFTAAQMKEIAQSYKKVLHTQGIYFENDPFLQLRQAILDVIDSWSSDRAKVYREHLQIAEEWGTAVIVQKMVLGNINTLSGAGVVFTHDPHESKSGINLYGDFAIGGQGEDVVAGWVHALPVTEYHRTKYQHDVDISLELAFPAIYKRLVEISTQLVNEYGLGPQEIEFTFEGEDAEDLYILQTRRQDIQKHDKRFVFRATHEHLQLVGRGIGIGGGALSGLLAFNMDDLRHFLQRYPDQNRILVRPDTVPDDIGMIFNCDGLLTGKGGATSHAAVTAVRLGKACVVGCKDLLVNEAQKTCTINGIVFKSGDKISIEGHLGNIYRGHYPTEYVEIT